MQRLFPKTLAAYAILIMPLSVGSVSAAEPHVSPGTAALLERAAEAAADRGAAAAAAILRHAAPESSDQPAVRFALAKYLLETGNIEHAMTELENTLQDMPDFHRARRNLAHLLLQSEQPGQAAAHLVILLDHDVPDKDSLYALLGAARLQEGYPAAAESAYRQALLRNPNRREARLGLIQTLVEQDRFDAADSLVRSELETRPDSQAMWNLLAHAALRDDRPDAAMAAMECARRLGLARAPMLASLGDLYATRDMPKEALELYSKLSNRQDAPIDRVLRGLQSLLALNHHDEAAELVAILEARTPELTPPLQIQFLLLKAELCSAQNDVDCAAAAYARVIDSDPLHGRALVQLGELYRRQGKLSRATTLLERAAGIDSVRSAALLSLAQIALAEGNPALAVDRLERSLEAQDRPHVRDYLRRLRTVFGMNHAHAGSGI